MKLKKNVRNLKKIMKLKNLNGDKTKTQIAMKLKDSNRDETQKLKL